MDKLVNLLTSQRFWIAMATLVALAAGEFAGIEVDVEVLAAGLLTIATLIIGISIREPFLN